MTLDQSNDTPQFLRNLCVKYELSMFLRKEKGMTDTKFVFFLPVILA